MRILLEAADEGNICLTASNVHSDAEVVFLVGDKASLLELNKLRAAVIAFDHKRARRRNSVDE
jgi:hypothetical protein